jgi:hypothetical protein
MRKVTHTLIGAFTLITLGLGLGSCNEVPVSKLNSDMMVRAVVTSESRIKIDFLWVMDDSSSMCQEQNSLADDYEVFIDELEDFSNIDYRVAVTTTDVRTDGFKGAFRNEPAGPYGPACQVRVVHECTADVHCNYLKEDFGPNWECTWSDSNLSLTINDNGSSNSMCEKNCSADDECLIFGDTFECMTQTSGAEGCIEHPQVHECPAVLPKVLDASNFRDFYCNATVGAAGTKQKNLEGGLKAGWKALKHHEDICRTSTPNVCDLYAGIEIANKQKWLPEELGRVNDAIGSTGDDQYREELKAYKGYLESCEAKIKDCVSFINPAEPNFLREDAYLVVIFVSDEDDCSDRDETPMPYNDTRLCAYETDYLLPIKELANYYRGLKRDPAKVIVVGIVGDALIEGSDSCIISDDCVHVRSTKECDCYENDVDKTSCPELLQGEQHQTMCRAPCKDTFDPEARKTQWCLADPPTDWCRPRDGDIPVQGPDTSNCYLLEDILAAYDKQIPRVETLAQTDPELLDLSQTQCANLLHVFKDERAVVQSARDACQPKLAEELGYRVGCLDACLGKKEYSPLRKCSNLPDAKPYCKCYDAAEAGSDECKAALTDEFAYRMRCKRECFKGAKIVSSVQAVTAPYICSSANGTSDFGSRYVDFISRFGRNGILANICAAGGIGRSLSEIATSILPIIFRVCIPKTPADDANLIVVRTGTDGVKTTLTQGDEADYEVVPDSQCIDTKKALIFHPVPAPSDRVEIYYEAASGQ